MKKRRALITGSSRGIGKAIAQKLAKSGWKVALHSSSVSKELEKAGAELGTACAGIYGADLGDGRQAAKLIKRVLADGPLHALVNNAGVYHQMKFIESGDSEFEANLHRTIAINFEAPARLCREAARHFKDHKGGKILNIASRVGFKGEPGAALYSASKAALINLTRSLAVELAPKKVQVFALAPGWVETAMAREGMEQRLSEILKEIPLGRMASPEDCANVAAFLLSDDAEYLSGIVVDINGASYFH